MFTVRAFLALLPQRFALPFLALPTARLLFPFAECLELSEEFGFPGLKVSLDAAMLALGHIAVPFSPSHDPAGTEHPQPPVHPPSNLGQEEGMERKLNQAQVQAANKKSKDPPWEEPMSCMAPQGRDLGSSSQVLADTGQPEEHHTPSDSVGKSSAIPGVKGWALGTDCSVCCLLVRMVTSDTQPQL